MAVVVPTRIGGVPAVGRWRDFDWVLLLTTLLLLGFGVAVISSTSGDGGSLVGGFAVRQIVFATVGLGAMLVLALTNYRLLASLALPLYVLTIGALVAVERIGTVIGGSARWFDLTFFLLQPSLFAQLTLVLAMATLLSRWGQRLRQWPWLLLSIAVLGLPAVLVYRQPDLGSALVFVFMWLALILASPARRLHLALLLLAAAPLAWIAWNYLAHDYQRDRFTIFLHPEQDPLGQGFNIIQARIAIGHGGLLGQGVAGGTQSQLEFLRVQNIDFIFAAASEQFGFVGSLALFALYIVLLWRCLVIAGQATEPFGMYLCVGVAAVYFFQAVVNIGMNMGLMPVTGIPLPLISYGGSSLLALLTLQGLVQSVALRRRKLTF
ncbi:MAG: rod shape-determining protein RodA [Chloroflexi bacterium]|nr:rod shape-determining protein RodA [Chloroflexota bacterium]